MTAGGDLLVPCPMTVMRVVELTTPAVDDKVRALANKAGRFHPGTYASVEHKWPLPGWSCGPLGLAWFVTPTFPGRIEGAFGEAPVS